MKNPKPEYVYDYSPMVIEHRGKRHRISWLDASNLSWVREQYRKHRKVLENPKLYRAAMRELCRKDRFRPYPAPSLDAALPPESTPTKSGKARVVVVR